MNKIIAIVFLLVSPFYLWAAEPIELTFSGELVLPSCDISFSDGEGENTYITSFGDVNESDIRYYDKSLVDSGGWTYPVLKISEIYHIKISGCTAESVSGDSNGKQFTLTMIPGAGTEWVNTIYGDNYLGGGLKPTTGATDFAVKIEVPATTSSTSGVIAAKIPESGIPAKWTTLTAAGQLGRGHGDYNETGFLASYLSVALSDLQEKTAGDGSSYWLLPMRNVLGMDYYKTDSGTPVGANIGNLNVTGILTVTYY